MIYLIYSIFSENIKGEDRSYKWNSCHWSHLSKAPNIILASIESNIIGLVNELGEVVEWRTHLTSGLNAKDFRSFGITVSTSIVISYIRCNMVSGAAVFSSVSSASHSVFRITFFEIVSVSILVVIATEDHVSWVVRISSPVIVTISIQVIGVGIKSVIKLRV